MRNDLLGGCNLYKTSEYPPSFIGDLGIVLKLDISVRGRYGGWAF